MKSFKLKDLTANIRVGPANWTIKDRLYFVMLAIIAFVAAFFLWKSDQAEASLAKESQSWPTTQGTVIESKTNKIEREHSESEKVSVSFAPHVKFEYVVDDKTFIGQRIRFGTTEASYLSAAEKIAAPYTKGDKVRVYYDQKQPKESVLEPGKFKKVFSLWPFALILLGILFMFPVITNKTIYTRNSRS